MTSKLPMPVRSGPHAIGPGREPFPTPEQLEIVPAIQLPEPSPFYAPESLTYPIPTQY